MAGRAQYSRQAAGRVSYADLSDSEGSAAGQSEEDKPVKKRSKRGVKDRKGKGRQQDEIESSGDEASDEANDGELDDDQPRKKRSKKTKSKGKGKAKPAKAKKPAKLEIFKRLPLELLCEVFSHLAPNNLLALSKVNKQFHGLLMAKGSESIWTAARRRLKLPDVEGLTEPQYAELIFGTKCQNCYGDKVGKIYHDFHIRRNLCKKCRRAKIIRIKNFAANEPILHERLHPFALACAMKTPHPGTEAWGSWQYRVSSYREGTWVFLDELWRMDAWLRDFDDQDEDSDIAAERESEEAPKPKRSAAARQAGRSSGRCARPRFSYKDVSESEEEPPIWQSRRAKRWKDTRAETLANRQKAAEELCKAFGLARLYLEEETRKTQLAGVPAGKQGYNRDRRRAIIYRFVEHYPQYEDLFENPYDVCWYGDYHARIRSYAMVDRSLTRLARGGALAEEEWSGIETKLRSLASRATKLKKDYMATCRRAKAQLSLSTRYEALKDSLPDGAQPFMPLFIDFLLLPSIKNLWHSGETITDHRWHNSLVEVREELDEYRVGLCVQARNAILDSTTDRAARAAADDCDETEALGDDFFQLATSFVCCAFPGCPGKQSPPGRRWDYTMRRAVYDSPEELRDKDPRVDWMGPLVDVLRHQHKHHNRQEALSQKEEKLGAIPNRVCLPLEVACGMLSVLELHNLDETRAKKQHLIRANASTSGYKWVNSKQSRYRFEGPQRYFKNRIAWSSLLAHIKLEGEKLAKSGLYLDPPNIALLRKIDKKKVIEMTEDELDSEDQDGFGDDGADDDEGEAAEQDMDEGD